MENIFNKGLKSIPEHLPSWKELTPEEVTFDKFPNGLSREVYKVTALRKDINPNTIIFRKFVNGEHNGKNDNHIELFAMKELGPLGVAAKLYATTPDYWIEEYLHSRVIQAHEINQKLFRRKLVLALAAIHGLELPNEEDKKGHFQKRFTDEFYKTFNAQCNRDVYDEEEAKFINEIQYLSSKEEIDFIQGVITKEKLVLSHNDVWVANILVLEKTKDVVFIDYEMMGYNFPGYDLGKLIFEPVFTRPKLPNPYWEVKEENFPSEEEIMDFAKYYLIASRAGPLNKEQRDELANDEQVFKEYENRLFTSEKEYKDALDSLMIQIRAGLLMSCYWCTTIGVVVGKEFQPEFGFIRFAKDNYRFYRKFKEQYLEEIAKNESKKE